MHVHLDNPDLQAKIERWTSETGRPADELVQDVMASYFEEIARVGTSEVISLHVPYAFGACVIT
ncbi:MAG TPA: hypothetical protein VH369_18355 [Bryobacteraceae bacterium]